MDTLLWQYNLKIWLFDGSEMLISGVELDFGSRIQGITWKSLLANVICTFFVYFYRERSILCCPVALSLLFSTVGEQQWMDILAWPSSINSISWVNECNKDDDDSEVNSSEWNVEWARIAYNVLF